MLHWDRGALSHGSGARPLLHSLPVFLFGGRPDSGGAARWARYRAEENAVRAEMAKISDERMRVKALQDDTYQRMHMLKTDKYGKTQVWGENRCARS